MPINRTAHPLLYRLAVSCHQLRRRWSWMMNGAHFASSVAPADLPIKLFSHKSVLLRKLGDADMRLQHNKVTNLRIASVCVNRIVIKPGETFSFWKLIGNPTAERGFLVGLLLSDGEVMTGVGGGLCQLANLLYWMALHSSLTIVERYRHSFDPFPDSGRVLPFGSGATVFYNYVDLQFRNDTDTTFEVLVRVDETYLHGELRADREPDASYHVIERNHRFLREPATGRHFRANELYQRMLDRRSGNVIGERLICKNHCLMKYDPPADAIVET